MLRVESATGRRRSRLLLASAMVALGLASVSCGTAAVDPAASAPPGASSSHRVVGPPTDADRGTSAAEPQQSMPGEPPGGGGNDDGTPPGNGPDADAPSSETDADSSPSVGSARDSVASCQATAGRLGGVRVQWRSTIQVDGVSRPGQAWDRFVSDLNGDVTFIDDPDAPPGATVTYTLWWNGTSLCSCQVVLGPKDPRELSEGIDGQYSGAGGGLGPTIYDPYAFDGADFGILGDLLIVPESVVGVPDEVARMATDVFRTPGGVTVYVLPQDVVVGSEATLNRLGGLTPEVVAPGEAPILDALRIGG